MTSSTAAQPITIRRATPADLRALDRLARLDSQRLTPGPHLVALADDRILASVDLHDGRVVADPFEFTQDVLALLQEHAGHVTAPAPRRAGVPALSLMRGLFPAVPRRA